MGANSVVLYDSEMENGARLDALSLLMKGERLPEGTVWAGIPAAWRDQPGPAPVAQPVGVSRAHARQRNEKRTHSTLESAA